jgi:site-specific DNA-methyltransferase (adenine-specific)
MFQLFNADCLEKMKDISSNSIDLILCDLPFGCLGMKRGGERVGEAPPENPNGNIIVVNKPCAWDVKIDLEAFWKEVRRIRKNDHTPTIHFCTTKYGFDLYNSNPKEFRYDLVWSKPNGVGFLSANKMPLRSHEMMYIFSKAGASYTRIDISGDFSKAGGGRSGGQKVYGTAYETVQPDNEGKRCLKSVIDSPNKKTKGGHPTAKPIELYKLLIERYCPPGGTVLDPTFGSCNSGRACKELKRHYIGIEKDKTFYETAKKSFPE